MTTLMIYEKVTIKSYGPSIVKHSNDKSDIDNYGISYSRSRYTIDLGDRKEYVSYYIGKKITSNTYIGFGIGSDNITTLRNVIWYRLYLLVFIVEITLLYAIYIL